METIAELRRICQTAFKQERKNFWSSNLYGYFIRIFSIYITRVLLPTPITANQVSLIMIGVGVLAAFFFSFPSRYSFLLGALLMQCWYTLDGVDGEVARYRCYQKTGSLIMDKRDGALTGMYIDMINHYIINFLVPITVAFGLFQKTGSEGWMLVGILASLAQVLMLAMHDASCRAQWTHLKRFAYVQVLKQTAPKSLPSGPQHRSFARWIFIALHHTLTYPAVMNWVTASALMNLVFPSVEWRTVLLPYLALGTSIVVATLIGRVIHYQLSEEEFRRDFRVSDRALQQDFATTPKP